jgi:RNA polymerase sigma factor (sigma-70 family)
LALARAEVAMDDAELVRQARAGNRLAFESLARRWTTRVMAVCHARLGRRDAVEDMAQETLLRGLRALPTLSDPARFGPWLCGIAARTCLDWLKAGARSEIAMTSLGDAVVHALPDASRQQPGEAHADRDEVCRLMHEVEKLPEEYREVLLHYYYGEYTYQELGEVLGVSAATINARLTKARKMLRERMDANDV